MYFKPRSMFQLLHKLNFSDGMVLHHYNINKPVNFWTMQI